MATDDLNTGGEFELRSEAEDQPQSSKFWLAELELADREEKDWRERAQKVVERYRDEKKGIDADSRLNILWSNTETLKSALYARTAKPDVRRRFSDADPLGRQVAQVLERSLEYCIDVYDVDSQISAAVEDYVLPGRGVCRVLYEPELAEQEVPVLDVMGFPTGETRTEEYLVDQQVKLQYVFWEDFRLSPARQWDDVRWVAFRHLMTRDELKKHWPDHGKKIPLNYVPKNLDNESGGPADIFKRAEVWEIWDKDKKQRVYVVKGYEFILEEEDDPLNLRGFFPIPEPLYGVRTNESLIPVPEYCIYQDQARELDDITGRIHHLISALRRRGVYDKSIEGLQRLSMANDNEYIGIENYQTLVEKGGLKGIFDSEELGPIAEVLVGLYEQRSQLIQSIYEVTGISDVIRGATDARETATAQRLKGQFGSMRLKKRQDAVQRFIRDLYRLKAEIIAEQFEPERIGKITGLGPQPEDIQGQQQWQQVVQVLRSDEIRAYKIDIETDSTIFEDAEAEKQSRIEMLTAVSGFLQQAAPMVQEAPQMGPLLFEMLEFGLRSFKQGRSLEDTVEQTKQAMLQAGQQQQPDPEQQKMQAELQMKQAEIKLKQLEMQHDAQMEAAKLQQQAMMDQAKLQQEGDLKRREQDQDYELELRDQNLDHQAKMRQAEMTARQKEQQTQERTQ